MMKNKLRIQVLRSRTGEVVIREIDRDVFEAKLFDLMQSILIERMRDARDYKQSRLLNLAMVKLHDNAHEFMELEEMLYEEGYTYDVKRVDV